MNVLICSDKFKRSLDAYQVCEAIARGLRANYPDYHYNLLPTADGGDGSLDILKHYAKGTIIEVATVDALQRPITASYLLCKKTAYIELAAASGIARLSGNEKAPLHADTRGTGNLIKDALKKGATEIILMIGGSCSTDAGLGIAYALGYRFLDKDENEVLPQGAYLSRIQKIISPEDLPHFSMNILCDVDNVLYGNNGAAHVFAPQKGATPVEVILLDNGLRHISQVINSQFNRDISTIRGGGSAGGVAAGLHGILGATIQNGFQAISKLSQLERAIQSADLVITGEGQLDSQSLQGKVVGHIAQLCRHYKKRLIVIVGSNMLSDIQIKTAGISAVYDIVSQSESIEDAIANAEQYIEEMVNEVV